MLGSHKFITAGYFLLAGVGGLIAYQQSGFTVPAADTSVPTTQSAALPSLPAPQPYSTNELAFTADQPLTPALLIAQRALASADALEVDTSFNESDVTVAQDATENASEPSSPWKVDHKAQRTPSFMLNDDIRDYEVVNTDSAPSYPEEGEQVQLTLLNGQQVVVNVKSSKVTRNGDFSWSGHLDGYGEDYPVVMTYGKTSMFAMITTPEGSYSMESVDGVGWLYKNPAEHELAHPGQEDFLEIPVQQQSHADQEEETNMKT